MWRKEETKPSAATATATSRNGSPTPESTVTSRISNGLKEFLWQLQGIGRGTLLDVGPVWGSTVRLFVERGFKMYTEDVLVAWRDFLKAEEEALRSRPNNGATLPKPAERAERFLGANLLQAPN